ncbi:LapA family protein [Nocardia carnea]|uniref:Lipopolysaccharide assembly LapA domain-containing protein n=1 Tax=Nocardia carnea TaxID=37328 RepID=A0ABW7TET4_9NOCA|nr:lipopolysaccharide assembly protein LapA domain-containing protein [Nocardia carnea]
MATSDDRTPDTGAVPGGQSPPGMADPLGGKTAPTPTGRKSTGKTTRRKSTDSSRVGNAWIALIIAAVLGIILLIFIIQNSESADVEMLFWNFSLPLGVTILLSVIAGALVMALVGGVRIMQLRRAVHKK